jgi:hypothetical protein
LAPLLVLWTATGIAATAYVSDDLILGVYAEKDPQSTRLATLHSGASLDVLATDGDFTQVRLGDGRVGWVRSSFLVTHEPATARVKELEDEISRAHAATPELAAAATHNEIEQLKADLAKAQSELQSARAAETAARPDPGSASGRLALGRQAAAFWPYGLAALGISMGLGFFLGYRYLDRRVRQKFGGLRVY